MCSGEGIYFAAKSGRMCAEAIVEASERGTRMIYQGDLQVYIDKFDRAYGPTYFVLDALQKLFYTSDAARESFVDLCESEYVQKVTFDSYLYKKVQGNNPIEDVKLLGQTLASLFKHKFSPNTPKDKEFSNPVESLNRLGATKPKQPA